MVQTEFDFADDIALVPESVEKAQVLLLSVDGECNKVGLWLNAKEKRSRASTLRRKSRSPPKMVQHSLSERTLSTLAPLSAPGQEGISLESTPRLEVHCARRPQKDYSNSGVRWNPFYPSA